MKSKSEFRRLMIQDPERVYEELERLRRIEAKARAWLEASLRPVTSREDEHRICEARETLRKAIGGE